MLQLQNVNNVKETISKNHDIETFRDQLSQELFRNIDMVHIKLSHSVSVDVIIHGLLC